MRAVIASRGVDGDREARDHVDHRHQHQEKEGRARGSVPDEEQDQADHEHDHREGVVDDRRADGSGFISASSFEDALN